MQFIQPTGLYPSGFPNYGQPYGFNNTPTPLQVNGYPEIIGEGSVTSIIAPDGSTQLLFMPTAQWWIPYLPNSNVGNMSNHCLNNLGAWFVRSIYSPLQQTVYSQPYQTPWALQNCRADNSDCRFDVPAQRFQLKFHNDTCTSTSDIHYFFPKQYNWLQKQTQCTGVQVETPPVSSIICNPVLCNCTSAITCMVPCRLNTKDKRKVRCKCAKLSNASNSEMSIEGSKSNIRSTRKCKGKKLNKRNRNKSSKSNVQCQCPKMAVDKSVTTYADKESCCPAEKRRQTQADCDRSSMSVACNGTPVHILSSRNFAKKTYGVSTSRISLSDKSTCSERQCKRPCGSGSCRCSETDYEE